MGFIPPCPSLTGMQLAIDSRLGNSENTKFIEQFRYIIVASQLLNEHSTTTFFKPTKGVALDPITPTQRSEYDLRGVAVTAAIAFTVALLLRWARGHERARWPWPRLSVVGIFFSIMIAIFYVHVRRQWLKQLRHQAIDSTALMISESQALDGAASSAITLIQEVELVSRGYRLSTPLPPVSRLEEQSQTKRCARLRRTLRSSLTGLITSHSQAYQVVRPLIDETGLEKYCDIYEVTPGDLEQIELNITDLDDDQGDSLKLLKGLYMQLYTIRKVLLCYFLAIEANGDHNDLSRWSTAVAEMDRLSSASAQSSERLGNILSEEDRILPPTPKHLSLPPDRQRLRSQLRKLGSFSQGIRTLQAKMHVLREESDKTLDESADVSELGATLMNQYESIGNDLKGLMEDWERGKAALAINIDKNEKRVSNSSTATTNLVSPSSPTFSLGGLTAVNEGPSEALKILNGEDVAHSSGSASDEEIFEAVALPRKRSSLTREERIVKMKEERERRISSRQSINTNTAMLRELQTVMNLRPRPRGSNRITSI
ncbi:MAG: hypothetical protein M1834_002823 [Cirrosporium novae-zelandiae]|nr:MAG: hypothetical protein M1834_002823 [Cirrosporium novae-zelandiae]